MEAHSHLSNQEFERQFATCSLDPSLFSHEAHLRLAWIHIKKYGLAKAEENIQKQLQDFVAYVGAMDKYHVTITIMAIRAVDHFMKQSNTDNFQDFINESPQLKTDFKALVRSHYTNDIFTVAKARTEFVAPDIV
ncbi:hypothetical protein ACFSTE_18130 [Aquimarina hainanensis]|uniref:Uncharacterized protein n=1 Tax=Aquimarina hainanensis TaxID=1578017 RepID=A0ABW5NCC6_9FLAO|nr:hypothetical protein [Aquimarina sp. TRL1]QKX06749.1 hypothetical protein HN014_18100 [Aquimarina sp. TRL1]